MHRSPCKKLKILLLGDASNFHNALRTGLTRLGHDVTVASAGSYWMDTERDINLRRYNNKLSGAWLWFRLRTRLLKEMSGFDIVSISNPIFLNLRPEKNRFALDFLRRNNTSLFLTALGTDSAYIDAATDPCGPLPYNEWAVHGQPSPYAIARPDILRDWRAPLLHNHCDYTYSIIDGAVSALYEYHLTCSTMLPESKLAYGGIPIDTESITPVELPDRPDKVILFLGMHRDRKIEKGTARILAAARRVEARHPGKCRLDIVENLPYSQYLQRMRSAHVVLDQLYSYSPATNALLAMAMGLNTLSGGEPEFYNFIGERRMRPIINAIPDDEALVRTLEEVVTQPELLRQRGIIGRRFVEKHNSCEIVANRFLNQWTSCMSPHTLRSL